MSDLPLLEIITISDIELTVKQKEFISQGWGDGFNTLCSMVLLYCPMHRCEKWVVNTATANLKASYVTAVGGRIDQETRTVLLNVDRK